MAHKLTRIFASDDNVGTYSIELKLHIICKRMQCVNYFVGLCVKLIN